MVFVSSRLSHQAPVAAGPARNFPHRKRNEVHPTERLCGSAFGSSRPCRRPEPVRIPGEGPSRRGLRHDRRLPHGGIGVSRRINRLAASASVRLPGRLRAGYCNQGLYNPDAVPGKLGQGAADLVRGSTPARTTIPPDAISTTHAASMPAVPIFSMPTVLSISSATSPADRRMRRLCKRWARSPAAKSYRAWTIERCDGRGVTKRKTRPTVPWFQQAAQHGVYLIVPTGPIGVFLMNWAAAGLATLIFASTTVAFPPGTPVGQPSRPGLREPEYARTEGRVARDLARPDVRGHDHDRVFLKSTVRPEPSVSRPSSSTWSSMLKTSG